MKVEWTNGSLKIEAEGEDVKSVFTELAGAVEVFTHTVCGACDSKDTIPCVRENGGNHYYEYKCRTCHAALGFGQRRQDGQLFPRTKSAKTGERLENNGWLKWQQRSAEADDAPF